MPSRLRLLRFFRPLAGGAILLVALALLAVPSGAQDESSSSSSTLTEQEINARALQLSVEFMSPYCPGANLRDCTSGKAADLRAEIRSWVAEGRSREWIEDELVGRYGESILGAPRFKGFNTLIWLAPFIALLVGGGLIFGYLQRQRTAELHPSAPAARVDDDHQGNDDQGDADRAAQLERELQDRSA